MKLPLMCLSILLISFSVEADKDAKIVIVGAGAAGIAAGSKLLENGFKNIEILEAENRIGGRINTVPFGSSVVDLGAQWCHGEEENVVYQLAKPHDLLSSATNRLETFSFVSSNGEQLDRTIVARLLKLSFEVSNNFKEELKMFNGSYGDFIENKFQEASSSDELKDIEPAVIAKFSAFYRKFVAGYDAADTWHDISATCDFYETKGDQFLNWKDKGYKTVLDLLMKKFPDPSQDLQLEKLIRLGKTVKTIDWTAKPVVTCADGTNFTADHVISTVSLGVLKDTFSTLFTPQLPERKANAIKGLKFGTVDKIYLEFAEPFWSSDFMGYNLLWNDNDLIEIRTGGHSWVEGIIGIFTVDFQPKLLEIFVLGKSAREMEKLPEEEVQQTLVFELKKFFKEVPEPVKIARTQWYSNPNFRGTWSYRSITSTDADRSILAEPLENESGKKCVQFAGEATSDHHYKSVHGAIETGWREAQKIIDSYADDGNN